MQLLSKRLHTSDCPTPDSCEISENFLRLPQGKQTAGLSKSSTYASIAEVTFPKQVPIGHRLVVWAESDIQESIAE